MSDDKTKRGSPDNKRVAGGEQYEVEYLAKKLGVPQRSVKEAIEKVGTSRAKVEDYIKKHK